jgi:hypothetical protein
MMQRQIIYKRLLHLFGRIGYILRIAYKILNLLNFTFYLLSC